MNITTLQHLFKSKSAKLRVAFIVVTTLFFLMPAIALAENSPPVVDAGPSQTIYLGDSTPLHGTATDPNGDIIVSWQWEVISAPGGNVYSIAYADTADANFTTDTVGNYVITLIASDGIVWSDPDATVVIVVENMPPTAVISASPVVGLTPLVVNFDGTGSSDPEGGTLLYYWSFDDGYYSTEQNPTHEYQSPDSYSVYLKVTDDHDNIDFDTIEIKVGCFGVSPVSYDFGDVSLGSATSMIFTATNVCEYDSIVHDIRVENGGASVFTITQAPTLPVTLSSGATMDVEMTFTPDATGLHEATLVFESGSYFNTPVPLSGVGVEEEPHPVTIGEILNFFDKSVEDGTLEGLGSGWLAKLRLCLMREMLVITRELIEHDKINAACFILQRTYMRCDDKRRPLRDFVVGDAVPELAAMIQELRISLGGN